jgi:hypothetical protein
MKKYCVRCQRDLGEYPALSRWDNSTEICSDCGTKEAFEIPTGWPNGELYKGIPYWNRESGNAKILERRWLQEFTPSWAKDLDL